MTFWNRTTIRVPRSLPYTPWRRCNERGCFNAADDNGKCELCRERLHFGEAIGRLRKEAEELVVQLKSIASTPPS